MGRFCVVLVGYILLGFISCAPPEIGQQSSVINYLETACGNKVGMDKVLPASCSKQEKIVSEGCLIIVDYTIRLCKDDGFTFKFNPKYVAKCPMVLPQVQHEKLKNDTKDLMEHLGKNETCLQTCTEGQIMVCNRISELAEFISKKSDIAAPTADKLPETKIIEQPKSAPHQPPVIVEPTLGRNQSNIPVVAHNQPNPSLAVVNQSSVAPKLPVPVPKAEEISPSQVAEPPQSVVQGKKQTPSDVVDDPEVIPTMPQPDAIKPVKPSLDLDDGESNDVRQDDYDGDEILETPKPAVKIISNVEEFSRAIDSNGPFQEAPDSHFFVYFLFFTCVSVIGYIAFHNKNKILALALEGHRGRHNRRRPNSASYRQLSTSLEETIMSNPSRVTNSNVIY